MKRANKIITILIFLFLYAPMIVLMVASFNTGKDVTDFEGFTLSQYAAVFTDRSLLQLLGNSLLIAILASGIATVFGTVASVGIFSLKPRMRKAVMSLTNIPMTNPDIVTGISLSLLFVFVGSKMLGQRNSLTFWTLLIAHITFNLPYVILNVMPKLQQMDRSLTDAAMDLGCTPIQSFFKVTLHEIMPGIISGAIVRAVARVIFVTIVGASSGAVTCVITSTIVGTVTGTVLCVSSGAVLCVISASISSTISGVNGHITHIIESSLTFQKSHV